MSAASAATTTLARALARRVEPVAVAATAAGVACAVAALVLLGIVQPTTSDAFRQAALVVSALASVVLLGVGLVTGIVTLTAGGRTWIGAVVISTATMIYPLLYMVGIFIAALVYKD